MHIDPKGQVVSDDVYVRDYMTKSGTAEFMGMCDDMLRAVCMAANRRSDKGHDELLVRLKDEIMDAFAHRQVDLGDVTRTIVSLNESNMMHIASKLDSVPRVMSKVDEVTSKLDAITASRNTNRVKGEEGETGLMDLLETKLSMRDEYTVQDVKNIPHSCDILVQRMGYPDIRIESKAHGRDNGRSVNTSEVRKFESDLIGLDSHGIFVSLYAGICGKGPIEIEMLPTKKFAVYLSNNNFDGDAICEYINLIYKLDQFTKESSGITVSPDTILRIKTHLRDFEVKRSSMRTNLKTVLATLNEISLDAIDKMLAANHTPIPEPAQQPQTTTEHTCPNCNKNVKSAAALVSHVRACKIKGDA